MSPYLIATLEISVGVVFAVCALAILWNLFK